MTNSSHILTINAGSSSVKAALYDLDGVERVDATAMGERIGLPNSRLRIANGRGETVLDQSGDLQDFDCVLDKLLTWLREQKLAQDLAGIGHRIVHGGSRYREPVLITDEVLASLEQLVPIDPDHLPQEIDAIEVTRRAFPSTPQVACFDTSFHRTMPRVAQMYALPRSLANAELVRFGFHGLSYEYIMQELKLIDPSKADGRVVIAHLGNGASMAAVLGGVGIDTTMGFSPTGGLVMSTRSGDLDPGVLVYLLQSEGIYPDALSKLVSQEAGLLGVSGTTGDMQDLLRKETSDPAAADAVDLFCYQARKYLGAMVAVLGGINLLVFTGGIGEQAPAVRERICAGFDYLGLAIDRQRNAANAPIITDEGSRAVVRVMKTNEDLMIARHTKRILAGRKSNRI